MKFLNIFLSVIFCFFGSFFLNPTQKNTSVFNGNIEHIFIHSLIAYPEILRQKSPQTISLYKKDCIDYIEFKNLLNELYKNNYVLIDIHKTYTVENGIAKKTKVRVPQIKNLWF